MNYIDLTQTFDSGMPVYPGDPTASLEQVAWVEQDGFSDHKLTTCMHVGTHIDAPGHMFPAGKLISEFGPEKFFGRGVIIEGQGKTELTEELVASENIKPGDIVLIHTGFGKKFGLPEYYDSYPVMSESLAEALVRFGVSMVGFDTPSPDKGPYTVHRILLEKEILILENLCNLEKVISLKKFEVIALPLRLSSNASPARVVVRV